MVKVLELFVPTVSEIKLEGTAAVDLDQVLHLGQVLLVLEVDYYGVGCADQFEGGIIQDDL